jgi:hypothetical protein
MAISPVPEKALDMGEQPFGHCRTSLCLHKDPGNTSGGILSAIIMHCEAGFEGVMETSRDPTMRRELSSRDFGASSSILTLTTRLWSPYHLGANFAMQAVGNDTKTTKIVMSLRIHHLNLPSLCSDRTN